MDNTNKRILEALQMQPLSQEEMTARHILGRLYGPIATCVESTRNGRLYNKPLWEKALKDDIFLEKVATKALFLELGHPADREETDMKQTCACIPEVPKIVGDDLCAYVDILDTPNGRLLKTLVDYGFVPGISSRGSGDVLDNNQVDPETFFLETWDIVQLPAVKKARLNVCESLEADNIKLKKALAESYKAAKEEDKDTMKKALENLNINIEDEIVDEAVENSSTNKLLTADDIPWDPEADLDETLLEEMPADDEDTEDNTSNTSATELADDMSDDEPDEDSEAEVPESKTVDVTSEGESEINTVGDALELLQEYDEDTSMEFRAVQADGETLTVDNIDSFIDKSDDTLVISVNCCSDDENTSTATVSNIDAAESSEENTSVETIEDVDDDDSAEDTGDAAVIESLKDMIRQKEALETEVSELRKAKSVGDAKEQELQEKLNRYRTAFRATSAEAAKVTELQAKIQKLNEQLNKSNETIKTLTEQVNNTQKLRESVDGNKNTIRSLNEEISKLTRKSATLEAKLDGQTKLFTEKLQERTNLAKSYKVRFIETLNKYVESKAAMLGVNPSEITNRLAESYTLADVDSVCDKILDSTINFSRLPFGGRTKTSARIKESVIKTPTMNTNPDYGYEIDDSLLELAGLKK